MTASKSFDNFVNFLGGSLAFLVVCLPVLTAFGSKHTLHECTYKVPSGNKTNDEMQVKD